MQIFLKYDSLLFHLQLFKIFRLKDLGLVYLKVRRVRVPTKIQQSENELTYVIEISFSET